MSKEKARNNLKLATAGMSSNSVVLLSLAEVSTMVGVTGLSVTFIRNIQQGIVTRIESQELQEIADDIVTRMKGAYPDIAAVSERNRIIKVWLDGLPKEVE